VEQAGPSSRTGICRRFKSGVTWGFESLLGHAGSSSRCSGAGRVPSGIRPSVGHPAVTTGTLTTTECEQASPAGRHLGGHSKPIHQLAPGGRVRVPRRGSRRPGGSGRRAGFRNRCPQGRGGSSPSVGTTRRCGYRTPPHRGDAHGPPKVRSRACAAGRAGVAQGRAPRHNAEHPRGRCSVNAARGREPHGEQVAKATRCRSARAGVGVSEVTPPW
jgi:hypothetical protein